MSMENMEKQKQDFAILEKGESTEELLKNNRFVVAEYFSEEDYSQFEEGTDDLMTVGTRYEVWTKDKEGKLISRSYSVRDVGSPKEAIEMFKKEVSQ